MQLLVTPSPHITDKNTTSKIMFTVMLALTPAVLMSFYFFGVKALVLIGVSMGSAVLVELILNLLFKKVITIFDGSALLTGLLLGMSLPPSLPLWMVVIGNFVAIGIAKYIFGGLGHNIFNPANVGRAFLLASYPVAMTTWHVVGVGFEFSAVTGATPLSIADPSLVSKLSMLIGSVAGSVGETSAIALLIGGCFLVYKKIIDWIIPAAYIGAVVGLALIFNQDLLLHLLSGGLILGAFFMATDYVTSPVTKLGKFIYALLGGILVFVIRVYGGYPEGVCYSILIINALAPLIDRYIK